MSTPNDKTLHLGICMAGAVSAGAYTAGVMDYLLEVLENWEQAKKLQEQGKLTGIPTHNILIEVLSGASAGGMTAAITVAAIQKKFPHIRYEDKERALKEKDNPIYNAWVNLVEKEGKDMMDCLFSTRDIEDDKYNNPKREARCGFNSTFIKEVADNVFDHIVKDKDYDRPYIAKDADVFTTLTNLRGLPYSIDFITSQGIRKHRMTSHRDIAHFQLNEEGEYQRDGKIPIHFRNADGLNKDILKQAAMATGAFPVGLEPRILNRQWEHIRDNKYINLYKKENNHSEVKWELQPVEEHSTLNVDGGVINNEPFELTQCILNDRRKDRIKKEKGEEAADNYKPEVSAEKFDTTVLMVDPFPNDMETPSSNYLPLRALKFCLPEVVFSMRRQLMVKTEDVSKAYMSNDYTRFLISPTRSKDSKMQKYSIACGSFGGFGGFFSKEFREHDFFLGRRNCQRFLQKYFSVPAKSNNPILEAGYKGIKDNFIYKDDNQHFLPLIPDIRVVHHPANDSYTIANKPSEELVPDYPRVRLSYLLGLRKKAAVRFGSLLKHAGNGTDPLAEEKYSPIIERLNKKSIFGKIFSAITMRLVKIGLRLARYFGKKKMADLFIQSVIKDMEERELLYDDMKNK